MDQFNQVSGVPSLLYLRCPKCNTANIRMAGRKEAIEKYDRLLHYNAIGGVAGGFIGSAVTGKSIVMPKQIDAVEPLEYLCEDCQEKFIGWPFEAQPEEFLQIPATIRFLRSKNAYGMAIRFSVYLNGCKIGEVKNGCEIVFQTPLRFNTVAVTDLRSIAFTQGTIRFEAISGGVHALRFNLKFF